MSTRILARILCFLIISVILFNPVQAFTAESLTVEIINDGDARISFNYTLTLMEQIAVYVKIANPNEELKKALESTFHLPVTVEKVTDSSAELLVSRYAHSVPQGDRILMETPVLSFAAAEKVLQKYWFAPLVHPDYSPQITTIIYPDGYTETFQDQITIPKTSHLVNNPIT
ncbi:MAG TPA: hypothetical protein VN372_02275 [Methanospirillum sp.]|nr:hypothetical protein [Methanospirillum sp.]